MVEFSFVNIIEFVLFPFVYSFIVFSILYFASRLYKKISFLRVILASFLLMVTIVLYTQIVALNSDTVHVLPFVITHTTKDASAKYTFSSVVSGRVVQRDVYIPYHGVPIVISNPTSYPILALEFLLIFVAVFYFIIKKVLKLSKKVSLIAIIFIVFPVTLLAITASTEFSVSREDFYLSWYGVFFMLFAVGTRWEFILARIKGKKLQLSNQTRENLRDSNFVSYLLLGSMISIMVGEFVLYVLSNLLPEVLLVLPLVLITCIAYFQFVRWQLFRLYKQVNKIVPVYSSYIEAQKKEFFPNLPSSVRLLFTGRLTDTQVDYLKKHAK